MGLTDSWVRMVGPQGVTLLGGVALLEEGPLWGWAFEVFYAQAMPSVGHSPLLMPVNQDVEYSAPSPAPCLPECYHVSHHGDNRLNL